MYWHHGATAHSIQSGESSPLQNPNCSLQKISIEFNSLQVSLIMTIANHQLYTLARTSTMPYFTFPNQHAASLVGQYRQRMCMIKPDIRQETLKNTEAEK
jgi:hypothetical protein